MPQVMQRAFHASHDEAAIFFIGRHCRHRCHGFPSLSSALLPSVGIVIVIIALFSSSSASEASLRLKRWLIAGTMHDLDPYEERQSHIALGGWRLSDLGSHTPWGMFTHDDLDHMINNITLPG